MKKNWLETLGWAMFFIVPFGFMAWFITWMSFFSPLAKGLREMGL